MQINSARRIFSFGNHEYLYSNNDILQAKTINHTLRKIRIAYEYLFDKDQIILFLSNGKRTAEVVVRYRTRGGVYKWAHVCCDISGRLNPHNALLGIIIDCIFAKTCSERRWNMVAAIPLHFFDTVLSELTKEIDPNQSFGIRAPLFDKRVPADTVELLPNGSVLLDDKVIEYFGPGSSMSQGIYTHLRWLQRVKGK